MPRYRKSEPTTLERYLQANHLMVSPSGSGPGLADHVLAQKGLKRNVVMRVPDFVGAVTLAAQTDLLLVVPERLGRAARLLMPVRVAKVPVVLPTATIWMCWHGPRTEDPPLSWLLELIRRVAAMKHSDR